MRKYQQQHTIPKQRNNNIRTSEHFLRRHCSGDLSTVKSTKYWQHNVLISLWLSVEWKPPKRWVIDFSSGSNQNAETLIKVTKANVLARGLGWPQCKRSAETHFQHKNWVRSILAQIYLASLQLRRRSYTLHKWRLSINFIWRLSEHTITTSWDKTWLPEEHFNKT